MQRYSITQGQYKEFRKITKKMDVKAGEYVPSDEEMEDILLHPGEYINFLMWIIMTGRETDRNAKTRKAIQDILESRVVIVKEGNVEET